MNGEKYDHKKIERKWQEKWEEAKLHQVSNKDGKEKYFALTEFPYPSGNLHVGHWYSFATPDIFVRKKRMEGKNVLYPVGFDAFGLPAENAAIKRKLDPKKWTYENMETMRKQFKSMGASLDWSKEVVTCDPGYYKWTQWIFTKMFEMGLAYRKKSLVNWDPVDKTVLANEQVLPDGTAERSGAKVEKKELEQWFLKITDYADRLDQDLDKLDWPEQIKTLQKNWIGKSEGAEFVFKITDSDEKITVFTTRADTLFGVTYVVLAPEHEIILKLKDKIENIKEVEKYIKEAKKKEEIERTAEGKEKTGIELKGLKVLHPATGAELPVWVADYVIGSYGTGAVMAVPAHDKRDFEFAGKYSLPAKTVVESNTVKTDGVDAVRSDKPFVEREAVLCIVKHWSLDKYLCSKWKTNDWQGFVIGGIEAGEQEETAGTREVFEETGYKNVKFVKTLGRIHASFYHDIKGVNRLGHFKVLYLELVDDAQGEVDAKEKNLHDILWVDKEKVRDFVNRPDLKTAWDMMSPGFCFTDDGILVNSESFDNLPSVEARKKITESFGVAKTTFKLRDWSVGRQRYWGCPVPIVYDPEGKPHAIPLEHLPWILPEDVDHTPTGEPPLARSRELFLRTEKIFGKGWKPEVETVDTFVDSSWYYLRYLDSKNEEVIADEEKIKEWMPVSYYFGGAEHTTLHLLYSRFFYKVLFDLKIVKEEEPYKRRLNRGLILGPDGNKMSKSKGNVIDPDELVERLGADTVRLYLAFMGPYNECASYPWDPNGVVGMRRFLERVWNLQSVIKDSDDKEIETLLHQTIKKISEDIETLKFNTAISQLMIFSNEVLKTGLNKNTFFIFLRLLAPFVPHIAEEIWFLNGGEGSVHETDWPIFDESKVKNKFMRIAVQVNGKTRGILELSASTSKEEVEKLARNIPAVQKQLINSHLEKVVYVPGRILNMVVKIV